jgi:hypothetical protein
VQIHGQQMTTSVALVKALGGGWDVNEADAQLNAQPKAATSAATDPHAPD